MASYLIMYGSEILFQAGNDSRPLHSVRLSSKMGVDQLTFVMPPSHPLRHSMRIRDLESSVTVSYGDQSLFCGFITRMTEQIDGQLAVTCVSDAQLLADVHVRMNDRLSAQMLFATAVGRYNQLMTAIGYDGMHGSLPDRTFVSANTSIAYNSIGYLDTSLEVQTNPPTYYLGTIGTSPTTVLDIIINGIVQPYGCLMRVARKVIDGRERRVIWVELNDYVDREDPTHFGNSGQSVIFGENMTSFESDSSDEGFYNGCCPLGKTDREYNEGGSGGRWLDIVAQVRAGDDSIGLQMPDHSRFTVHANDIIVAMNIAYTVREDTIIYETGSMVPISPSAPHSYPAGGMAWYAGSELLYTDSTVTLDRLDDGTYGDDGEPKASEAAGGKWMVNGNVVYNIESVRQYGLRTYTFNDSEIDDARPLLKRAIREIQSQMHFKESMSVDAVDMAFYRDGYNHLLIGQIVQVVPKGLGQSQPMRVVEANLDLDNPSATRYTFGQTPDGVLDKLQAAKSDTNALRDRFTSELENYIPESTIRGLS